MGYYSEVALCLPIKAHKSMLEALEKENAEVQIEVKSLLGDAEKTEKEEATLYYWPWVKWYTSFLCVGFITRFLRTLDEEEEEDLQYRLLAVGESLEDNRDDGDFWETPFELDIVRNISFA